MREGVCDGLSRNVRDGDCHRPTGEPVDYGQKVAEPVRRGESYEVHVEVAETPRWNFEFAD